MPRQILPSQLIELVGTPECPHVVDVRRRADFDASPVRIAGACWRNHMEAHDWHRGFAASRPIVVYCKHGHNVSEIAAARLAAAGRDARVLAGGLEAYRAAGGLLVANAIPDVPAALSQPTTWVTRERPKIDRIACPWLIRRFLDPSAVFHFVAADWVLDVAAETGAIPFDVEGVRYSHRGETCSFDTMLQEFGLEGRDLSHLARIVRAADTARLDLEPQAAGLLAISLGLSSAEPDDLRQLDKGMAIYDALLAWCRHAVAERHNWPAGTA